MTAVIARPAPTSDRTHPNASVAVLIVDDNPTKRMALKAVLAPLGYLIVEADSGLAGLRCLMGQDFAVILLDVQMPVMDGFETAHMIRQRKQSELTPIIFVTAYGREAISNIAAYATGAADFIFSPVNPAELRAKVSVFANLYMKGQELAAETLRVQQAADHLSLLTDATPVGIFRLDVDGNYTYVNERWCDLTGLAAEEVLGQPWQSIVVSGEGSSMPDLPMPAGAASQNWHSDRFRIDGRTGGPLSTVKVRGKPIYDAAGAVVDWIGALIDVSAEEAATAALAGARDAAVAANVMQSNFAASAAHELKTPTASVLGFIEEVLDNPDLAEDDRRCLDVAYRNAKRLGQLIDDLLILGESEINPHMMRLEPTSLTPLLGQTVSAFSSSAQRASVKLLLDPDSEQTSAIMDPLRFEQALSNLISNGLKFTPRGGQVTVGARQDGDVVHVTVTDTGIGIDPESLDHIFRRFYRGEGALQMGSRGSGLGLAIAQQMITAQNGTITVTSEVGRGSVFRVTLPAARSVSSS